MAPSSPTAAVIRAFTQYFLRVMLACATGTRGDNHLYVLSPYDPSPGCPIHGLVLLCVGGQPAAEQ
jgi:hypothetical protein